MLEVFDKNGNARSIAEKSDLHKTYRVKNRSYVNLQDARVFFNIFDGLYLIKAYNGSGNIAVVIAYWSESYRNTSIPDIIFFYNSGISYKDRNSTGTIAFDNTCETIDVIPLMIV